MRGRSAKKETTAPKYRQLLATSVCVLGEYLAQNVAKLTKKKILTWKGHCEVHERFTPEELLTYNEADPSIQIVAHPECPPEVS